MVRESIRHGHHHLGRRNRHGDEDCNRNRSLRCDKIYRQIRVDRRNHPLASSVAPCASSGSMDVSIASRPLASVPEVGQAAAKFTADGKAFFVGHQTPERHFLAV